MTRRWFKMCRTTVSTRCCGGYFVVIMRHFPTTAGRWSSAIGSSTAHKVVGVGSVGGEAAIVLLDAGHSADPLLLQLKQAEASIAEPSRAAAYHNHGRARRGRPAADAIGERHLPRLVERGRTRLLFPPASRHERRSRRGQHDTDLADYAVLCGCALRGLMPAPVTQRRSPDIWAMGKPSTKLRPRSRWLSMLIRTTATFTPRRSCRTERTNPGRYKQHEVIRQQPENNASPTR